ncbi:MAG: GIY-YIG nuclease family protein [Bacteroidetes bacterium]|nr:GIY-YIG nuclease family protein [Bacteroidota bacterium]
MPQPGYIYILINPTLNGLVKIGKTSKTSEERAKELSSATGVPTQFMVAYDEFFEDIDLAENHVHEVLKNMGHHVFPNKEFFDIALKDAIGILNETKKYYNTLMSKMESKNIFEGEDYDVSPFESILEEAYRYKLGSDEYFQDDFKAFDLFLKAYNLGSGEACVWIAESKFYGEGCSKNEREAFEYLREGVKRGEIKCYVIMEKYYTELGQIENAGKCLKLLFDTIKGKDDVDSLMAIRYYFDEQIESKKEIKFIEEIISYIPKLVSLYEYSIENYSNNLYGISDTEKSQLIKKCKDKITILNNL